MAYVTPTPGDVVAAYPEFTGVSVGVIQGALDEAATKVDAAWSEATFKIGQMLYAAHVLVMSGIGSSAAAQAFLDNPGGLKMRKDGDTVEEYFGGGAAQGVAGLPAWYAKTGYGQRFYAMQRGQRGGPRAF